MGVVNPQQNTQNLLLNRPANGERSRAQDGANDSTAAVDQAAPGADAQTPPPATDAIVGQDATATPPALAQLDKDFVAQVNASFYPSGTAGAAASTGAAGTAKEGDTPGAKADAKATGDAGGTTPTEISPAPVTAAPTASQMAKEVIKQSAQVVAVQMVAYSEPPKQTVNTGNAVDETEDLRLHASVQASQVINDVSLTTHNTVARAGMTGNAGGALSSIRSLAGGSSSRSVDSLVQASSGNISRAQASASNRIATAGISFASVATDMAAMAEFYAQQASIGDAENNAWISEQYAGLALSAARSSENAVAAERTQADREIDQLVSSSQAEISAMMAFEEANKPANGQSSPSVGQVGLGNPFLGGSRANVGLGNQFAAAQAAPQTHATFGGGLKITA